MRSISVAVGDNGSSESSSSSPHNIAERGRLFVRGLCGVRSCVGASHRVRVLGVGVFVGDVVSREHDDGGCSVENRKLSVARSGERYREVISENGGNEEDIVLCGGFFF